MSRKLKKNYAFLKLNLVLVIQPSSAFQFDGFYLEKLILGHLAGPFSYVGNWCTMYI